MGPFLGLLLGIGLFLVLRAWTSPPKKAAPGEGWQERSRELAAAG